MSDRRLPGGDASGRGVPGAGRATVASVPRRIETTAHGASGTPLARLRLLIVTVSAAVTAFGLMYATGRLPNAWDPGWLPEPDRVPSFESVLAVTGVTALAQLLLLNVRTGTTKVGFAWGEAAAVFACFWLPAGFVPAVVLSGVLAARMVQVMIGQISGVVRAVANAAALSLAAAAAALAALLAGAHPTPGFDLRTAGGLAVAGLTYYIAATAIVAAMLAAEHREMRFWRAASELSWSKAPMAAGNIVLSVAALAALRTNALLLLGLPPLLWLLHQTYSFRLRGDDERRTWQVFAETTRHLNHLDEPKAAVAGLRGAVRLFEVSGADILIDGPPGEPRAYTLAPTGAVTRTEPPGPTPTRPAAVRPLLVGGVRIGELRLHRDTPLGRRDGLVLAAYGDALAAALHDAGTNTELRTLTERRTFDSVHDPLTGLNNRASLLARGTTLLRSLDPAAPVALLLLDINDFKNVNTTLGLAAGDELLRRAARRLGRSGEPGDLLARLGGDEFALLITGTGASLDDALDRARHLAEELAVPIEVSGVQLSVESSTGVVVAAAGSVGMTELLRRADIAMYQAKRAGSSVVVYDPARDDASTDRLALLAELREALAGKEQIDVVLQPSVALATGRPVGVEAFVRWQHPRRGTLIPRDFVRAVEQSELLGAFTRCVLDRALAVAGALAAQGTPLPVSVNLSPRSLHDRNLPRDVAALLERHGVPAERLVLEITETVVLSSDRVVDEVLGEVRALGVQLAVDDFGTGCSALTFLTRVPVDEVKIDRTFVTRMVDSPEAAAIVRTTVELARELGLRVVAEGVESAEQRAVLVALSCPSAQGFHFYATLSADRMLAVAREAAEAEAAEVAAEAERRVRRLRAAE